MRTLTGLPVFADSIAAQQAATVLAPSTTLAWHANAAVRISDIKNISADNLTDVLQEHGGSRRPDGYDGLG